MPDDYGRLLDATIQHLEDLKSRGVRNVAVAPEPLRALAQPAPQDLRSSRREEAPSSKSEIEMSLLTSAAADNLPGSTPSPATRHLAAPKRSEGGSSPEKAAAFAALRERALACGGASG